MDFVLGFIDIGLLLPILVLFFERLSQFLSKRQAIFNLDLMSIEFSSVSHRTIYILSEEFCSLM